MGIQFGLMLTFLRDLVFGVSIKKSWLAQKMPAWFIQRKNCIVVIRRSRSHLNKWSTKRFVWRKIFTWNISSKSDWIKCINQSVQDFVLPYLYCSDRNNLTFAFLGRIGSDQSEWFFFAYQSIKKIADALHIFKAILISWNRNRLLLLNTPLMKEIERNSSWIYPL